MQQEGVPLIQERTTIEREIVIKGVEALNLNPEQIEEAPKAIEGRVFGEGELLGGTNHSYQTCAEPAACLVHKEEWAQQNPPPTLLEKVKEGLHDLKEALFGPTGEVLEEDKRTEALIEQPESVRDEAEARQLPHTKPAIVHHEFI